MIKLNGNAVRPQEPQQTSKGYPKRQRSPNKKQGMVKRVSIEELANA